MRLNDHELAAVLAGLRLLQCEYDRVLNANPASELGAIRDILNENGEADSLGPSDIDVLCERMNLEGPEDLTERSVQKLHELVSAAKLVRRIAGFGSYVWPEGESWSDDQAEDALSTLESLIAEARQIMPDVAPGEPVPSGDEE